jgi:Ribbon-helix-helix domain
MTKHYTQVSKSKQTDDEPFTRTALFFRDEQMQKLRLLSAAASSPVAELVRRAVDSYLEHRKEEWEPLVKKK